MVQVSVHIINLYLTFLDKYDGLVTLNWWYLPQSSSLCVAKNPIFQKNKSK